VSTTQLFVSYEDNEVLWYLFVGVQYCWPCSKRVRWDG